MQDKLSMQYNDAVQQIKLAILRSQYRAAKGVNAEQLSLYFGIGRYISEHSRKGYWGTGAIEGISEQLQRELPGLRGFSGANLKFMRQFYEAWMPCLHSAAVATDSAETDKSIAVATEMENDDCVQTQLLLPANRLPMAIGIDYNEFVSISFTHQWKYCIRSVIRKNDCSIYIRHT